MFMGKSEWGCSLFRRVKIFLRSDWNTKSHLWPDPPICDLNLTTTTSISFFLDHAALTLTLSTPYYPQTTIEPPRPTPQPPPFQRQSSYSWRQIDLYSNFQDRTFNFFSYISKVNTNERKISYRHERLSPILDQTAGHHAHSLWQSHAGAVVGP